MAGFLYSKHIWQFFFYKINSFSFCTLRFYLTMLMLHIRCTYIAWMFWLSSCVKKLWLKIWLQIQRSIFFKSHFQLQGQKIVRVDQTSHVPKFKSIIYRLYIKIYYIPQQYIIVLRYDLVKFSFLFPKVGLK